jgi:NADH-quinone oxidoreductase subunit N
MVAVLLRFLPRGALQQTAIFQVFAVIAIASMCAGNLLALRQNNVKRILAYSSIAHFGYILVALLTGRDLGSDAVTFYLVSYTVTLLVAFGVVTVLSGSNGDAGNLEDYRGLFWRRPVIAGIFTVVLFSLAGIPATMGFLAKFYVLAAGAAESLWLLILVLAITSVAGLFYYLRIVVSLYAAPPERASLVPTLAQGSAFVLGALTIALIWFGVYPAPLFELIRAAIG